MLTGCELYTFLLDRHCVMGFDGIYIIDRFFNYKFALNGRGKTRSDDGGMFRNCLGSLYIAVNCIIEHFSNDSRKKTRSLDDDRIFRKDAHRDEASEAKSWNLFGAYQFYNKFTIECITLVRSVCVTRNNWNLRPLALFWFEVNCLHCGSSKFIDVDVGWCFDVVENTECCFYAGTTKYAFGWITMRQKCSNMYMRACICMNAYSANFLSNERRNARRGKFIHPACNNRKVIFSKLEINFVESMNKPNVTHTHTI